MTAYVSGIVGGVCSGALVGFAYGANREREVIKNFIADGKIWGIPGPTLIMGLKAKVDESEKNLKVDRVVGGMIGLFSGISVAVSSELSMEKYYNLQRLPLSAVLGRSVILTTAFTVFSHLVWRGK